MIMWLGLRELFSLLLCSGLISRSFAYSPKGWTDGGLSLPWIRDFDAQPKEKAEERTRILLLDGHSSHYTIKLLEYANNNNIIVLAYPPHCTHALQGLDVVCFAKMKAAWREEIHCFEELHQTKVTKGDF